MHVLLTGATGFIGRHLCARLLADGHRVTAAVRAPASARRRFPGIHTMAVDLNRMTAAADWAPLLAGVDAVVNCAGILQSRRGQSADAIHARSPAALFDACAAAGIRRVVQISAVSADPAAGTEYALSKKAADDHLRALDLDWVVLRPSLVYGPGSHGGTSTLRGLAGLPWLLPLIGDGGQPFQPIHVDDLAATVARCLTDPALARRTLDPVGPETLTLRQILEATRAWLDLPPARPVRIPTGVVRLIARAGDAVGRGPITTTALRQLDYGNVADPATFKAAIGFRPRSLAEAYRQAPSHVQDRWHARLYWLKPALTAALALLWLGSGAAGLLNPPPGAPPVPAVAFSLLDIAIGLALAAGRGGPRLGLAQGGLVAGYTLGIGAAQPALWLEPYGPLLKNLPILAAIAAWTALQDER